MSDNKQKLLKKKAIGPVGIVLIVIGILAICGIIIFVVISTKPCPSGTTSHRFDNGMSKCVKPCNGTLFLDSKHNPQCCIPPKQIWEDGKGKTCNICQPGQTEVFEIPGDESSDSACIKACDPNSYQRCPPALDYDNILSDDLKKDFPFLTNKLNLENPEDSTSVTCIPKNAKCLISSSGETSTCGDSACGELKDKNGNSLGIFTQCCGSPSSSSVLDCPNCVKLDDPNIKNFSTCSGKSLSPSDYVSQCFGCPIGQKICPDGSSICCTKPEISPCSSPNCCSAPSCCVTDQDQSGGTSICCPAEHIRKIQESSGPELICCPDESWLAPTPSEPGICCPESHPMAIKKERTCGKYCGQTNPVTNVCYTSDGLRETPTTYCNPETVKAQCQSPGAQCKPLICKTGSQTGKPPEFCFESPSSGGICMTSECNATVHSNSPGPSTGPYNGGGGGLPSPGTKPVAPPPSGDKIWGEGCLKINNLTVFPEFEIQNPGPGVENAYPLCAYYDSKTSSNTDTNPNIACGLDPKSEASANYFRKLNFDITPDVKLLQNMGYNGTTEQQNALNDVLEKACLEMAENTNAVQTGGTVKYNEYTPTTKTKVGNYGSVPVGNCQINWFCGEAINNNKWSGVDNSQVSAPCEENQLYKALDKTISDYKTNNKVPYPYWHPEWKCNQKDTGTNSFMNSPWINDKMTSVDSCNPWNPTTGKCQLKGCESTSNINLYPSVIKQDSSGAGNICALSIDGTNESTGELPVVGPVIPYSQYDQSSHNTDYNGGLTCASKFEPDITPKTGSSSCRYQPRGYINFPYTYVDKGTENCSTESCTGGVTKENFSNPAGICDPNASRSTGEGNAFEKIFNPCLASDTSTKSCTICSDNVGKEFVDQICTQNVQLCPYLQPDLFRAQGSTISMENLTKSLINLIQEEDTIKTTDPNAINSNWYLPMKFPNPINPTKTVNLYPVVYKDYLPGNNSWRFTPSKYIQYDPTTHTLEYLKYDNTTKQVSWKQADKETIPSCYGLRWFPSDQSAWADTTSTIELIPDKCNTWNTGGISPFTDCIRLMHQKAKNAGKGTIIGPPKGTTDEYSQRIGCIECQSANSDCGGSPNSSYKGACYNNKQTGVLNCKQCNNPPAPEKKFDTNWIPNYIDPNLTSCTPCSPPPPNFYYDPIDNPPGLVGENGCIKAIIPPKPDFVDIKGLGCAWVGDDYASRVGKIGYGDFNFESSSPAERNYAICLPCSAQDGGTGITGKGGTGDDNSMDNCYYWQPTELTIDPKTGNAKFSPIVSPGAIEACKALSGATEKDLNSSPNPYINNNTRGLSCTCKNWYDETKNSNGTIYDSSDLKGVYGCSNLMDYKSDDQFTPTSNVCSLDKKTAQIDYGCYQLGTVIADSETGRPAVTSDSSIGGTHDFINWDSTECYMGDNKSSCFPCGGTDSKMYGFVQTGVQGGLVNASAAIDKVTGINNAGNVNSDQESCACFINPHQSGGMDCCLSQEACTGYKGANPFKTGIDCLKSNQPKLSHIQTDKTKCATTSTVNALSFGTEGQFWNSGTGKKVGEWPPPNL